MIQTVEYETAGHRFEITQLPYFRAQRLFFRLLKLAGPGLVGLATAAGASGAGGAAVVGALASLDEEKLSALLGDLFAKLEPEEMERLTLEILATTRVYYAPNNVGDPKLVDLVGQGGGRGAMDIIIGGDFWAGLMLQAKALSVHFGNFNSARGAIEALGLRAKASASPASTTSTDGKAGS